MPEACREKVTFSDILQSQIEPNHKSQKITLNYKHTLTLPSVNSQVGKQKNSMLNKVL